MQVLLALGAAGFWGSGNFAMGLAGRRASPRAAVFVSFSAGLIGALVFLAFQRPGFVASDFMWGALAGTMQGAGWALFAIALNIGRISVVAPVVAATAATAVYTVGVLTGDAVTTLSLLGATLALVAIVLLSRPHDPGEDPSLANPEVAKPASGKALPLALATGFLFTGQILALNQAGEGTDSLVMVGARLAAAVLIGSSLLIWRRPKGEGRSAARFAVPAGLALLFGDVAFLAALNSGPLTTASVLSGLHPVATIVLAHVVLREQVNRTYVAGIVAAIAGTALIAAG